MDFPDLSGFSGFVRNCPDLSGFYGFSGFVWTGLDGVGRGCTASHEKKVYSKEL